MILELESGSSDQNLQIYYKLSKLVMDLTQKDVDQLMPFILRDISSGSNQLTSLKLLYAILSQKKFKVDSVVLRRVLYVNVYNQLNQSSFWWLVNKRFHLESKKSHILVDLSKTSANNDFTNIVYKVINQLVAHYSAHLKARKIFDHTYAVIATSYANVDFPVSAITVLCSLFAKDKSLTSDVDEQLLVQGKALH